MKLKLLFFSALFISFITFAQNNTISNCNYNYKLETINPVMHKKIAMVEEIQLSWDFSKISTKNVLIKVEIVPILDCFNTLNASNLKDSILISSLEATFSNKSFYKLSHTELQSKCFKYRVIFESDSCKQISDWQFYSFFNN